MNPITITLTLQQWNQILGILGEAPYRVVAEIIVAIQTQAAQATPARANGPDVTDAEQTQ
jgi:hypothetical protein